MLSILLILSTIVMARAQFPLNTSLPEQYACVLASDQYVPTQSPQSPFLGILYLTVTPLVLNAPDPANNQFRIDTFLYHNVDYATDASICGPAARGRVNGSTCFIPLYLSPQTADSKNCPLYSHMTVYQEVVNSLREGQLFATITSSGLSSGQLRGQIETRNDIFFVPLANKNQTRIVGASLIRLFDVQGYTFVDVNAPAGVELYYISDPEYDNYDISGIEILTNLSAVNFGYLVITNSVANTIFVAATLLPVRKTLEKSGLPVYGFNSSNMLIHAQDFSLPLVNNTDIIPSYILGQYIRLPYLRFVGNEVLIFTQTGSGFGGGGGGGGSGASSIGVSVMLIFSMLLLINMTMMLFVYCIFF